MNTPTNKEPLFTYNYIIICIVNLAMVMGSFPLVTVLPLYLLGNITQSTALVGFLIGVFPFCALLSRFFAGWLLDNYSVEKTLKIVLLIFGLLLFVYPLIDNPFWFMVLRAAHGFTFGTTMTALAAAVIKFAPVARRGEGIGYFNISISLGMALGPFVALAIVSTFSFTAFFVFLALLTLISLGLFFSIKFPAEKCKPTAAFNLRNMFLGKAFWISINVFLTNTVYAGIVAFAIIYAKGLNIGDGIAALFFLFLAFSMLVTRLFSGRIFDRSGPKLITATGIIVLALGCLLMAFATGATMLILGGVGVGLGTGIIFPSFQTMINNMTHHYGAANATYYVGLDLGWVFGTTWMGFMVGLTSISSAYLMTVVICGIALVLFLAVNVKQYNKGKVV